MDIVIHITRYTGVLLLIFGCFFELVGAIGVLKVKDFFIRAHVATLSIVGGTIAPLIGLALISLTFDELGWSRVYLTTLCVATAILLLITSPTGSHALMRAAYISKTRKKFDEEHKDVER